MDGLVELKRLLHNIVRLGTIADVDHVTARARLRDGDLLTAWRPWLELRAGATRTWNPPTSGEQAMLLSAGGDPADSIILTGLFSDKQPAPADDPAVTRTVYPDGATIDYDHNAHHLSATLPGSAILDAQGAVDIIAGGDITASTQAQATLTAAAGAVINADLELNGNFALNGNMTGASGYTMTIASPVEFTESVTHNGKRIDSTHKHGGVKSGGDETDEVA